MVKYTKIYSGGVPEFKEDDIFRTVIPITRIDKNKLKTTSDKNYTQNYTENYTESY